MKRQSWKWNMRRIFIIQMNIWSNLVGTGTRWSKPMKELFEKSFYRPKKLKDKPAWFMIGPIRLSTTIMVYLKVFGFIIYVNPLEIGFGLYKPIKSRFGVLNQLAIRFGFGFPKPHWFRIRVFCFKLLNKSTTSI